MCQALFTVRPSTAPPDGGLLANENTGHVGPRRARALAQIESGLCAKRTDLGGRARAAGAHGHGVEGEIEIARRLGPRAAAPASGAPATTTESSSVAARDRRRRAHGRIDAASRGSLPSRAAPNHSCTTRRQAMRLCLRCELCRAAVEQSRPAPHQGGLSVFTPQKRVDDREPELTLGGPSLFHQGSVFWKQR